MRTIILFSYLFTVQLSSYAQTDTVPVNAEYIKYIFDPETKTVNLSYDYSNKWDFDGDNKKDSLFFIGNNGAHTYFYLRLVLSSDGLTKTYPSIQLDMPYFNIKEELEKWGKNPVVQFVVADFDNDGVLDMYLNFNDPYVSIPNAWKAKGITTKYILMSFNGGKLKVRNYKFPD